MESGILLATSADDVRLWSMPDLILRSVLDSDGGSVASCCCSNDGALLAYTQYPNRITVSPLKEPNELLSAAVSIQAPCEQSSVSFSRNSRFLVSGGADCVVNIWDIRSRICAKTFKTLTNPISYCIFNFNGSVIASASDHGEITLTEVQSGLHCETMNDSYSETITCLAYSHFKRYILGSTSNSGAVALWDTKQSKLMESFTGHSEAATCVSFSPLNDLLICSTGMDKRVIFYDIQSNKIVKIIKMGEAVTACDFMNDGVTVAIGSTSGHVSTLDLRHGSSPLGVVKAHNAPVTSVSFQKVPKNAQTGRKSSERKDSVNSRQSSDTVERSHTDSSFPARVEPRSKSSSQFSDLRSQSQYSIQRMRSGSLRRENSTASLRRDSSATSLRSIPQETPEALNNENFLEPDASLSHINPASPARRPVKREKKRWSVPANFDEFARQQPDITLYDVDREASYEHLGRVTGSTQSEPMDTSDSGSEAHHSVTTTPGSSRFLLKKQNTEDLLKKRNSILTMMGRRKNKSSSELYADSNQLSPESDDNMKRTKSGFFRSPFTSRRALMGTRKRSDDSFSVHSMEGGTRAHEDDTRSVQSDVDYARSEGNAPSRPNLSRSSSRTSDLRPSLQTNLRSATNPDIRSPTSHDIKAAVSSEVRATSPEVRPTLVQSDMRTSSPDMRTSLNPGRKTSLNTRAPISSPDMKITSTGSRSPTSPDLNAYISPNARIPTSPERSNPASPTRDIRKSASDMMGRFTAANENVHESSRGQFKRSASSATLKQKQKFNRERKLNHDSSNDQGYSSRSSVASPLQTSISDSVFHVGGKESSTEDHSSTPDGSNLKAVIEEMITESLEESRIALHDDLMTLQVEMVRQMEVQRQQFEQMFEYYKSNDDLVKKLLGMDPGGT